MTSPHIDPVVERLIRVEVLNDVTRKDVAEIKTMFREMRDRLDKIDDDIKAAKVGGKTLWTVGVLVAGLLGFFAHNILPYFGSLPR